MAKLILHLGSHKTGSSSLQRALAEAIKPGRGAQYLYPQSCRNPDWPYAHHGLAEQFKHDAPLSKDLVREIETFSGDAVILSCEDLFHWDRLANIAAFETADLFEQIEIVLYLRRPDRFVESWYAESVRRGTTVDFPEAFWLAEHEYFLIEPRIRHLREHLPSASIDLRSYEIANQGEGRVVGDFFRKLGIAVPKLDPDLLVSNRSLPPTATAAFLYANQRLKYAEQSNGLNKLVELFYKMERVFPKSELGLLSDGMRREILNMMRYDAHMSLQLCDVDQQVYEFFPDYNSFFGTRGDVFSNKRDMEPIFDVLAPVLALLSFELDRHA